MKYNGLQAIGLVFIVIGALGYISSTAAFFILLHQRAPNIGNVSISTSITSLAFLTLLFIGILSLLWDMGIALRFGKIYTQLLAILGILILLIPMSAMFMYFIYSSTGDLLKTYASPLRNIIVPIILLLMGLTILLISKKLNPENCLS